jgi:hypothetical protein
VRNSGNLLVILGRMVRAAYSRLSARPNAQRAMPVSGGGHAAEGTERALLVWGVWVSGEVNGMGLVLLCTIWAG